MNITKADIKKFREYLNQMPGNQHRHGRFRQRTRKYGDYLYYQDRERFMADLEHWMVENDKPAVITDSEMPITIFMINEKT